VASAPSLPDAVPAPDFTRDTAVTPMGGGLYAACCSLEWAAPIGPNGGYLAAMVLRAMVTEIDDPGREPRSLTLHYLRAPMAGPATVTVTTERTGRTMSTLSARLEQEGRLCIIAIGAFGAAFPSAAELTTPAPATPAWTDVDPWPLHESMPPISHRLLVRPTVGPPPFSGAAEAVSGGWLSLRESAPMDAMLLALFVDAWLPAVFAALTVPAAVPTIDLTVHFRDPRATCAHPAEVPLFCLFRSTTSQDGYVEEDGSVWAPDGTLLAQSRQLALLRPVPGAAG
jgi:acyl-CoA thioesterase